LSKVYKTEIISIQPKSMVMQFTGTHDKVAELLEVLKPYRIVDISRTGEIALTKE
jgi:acetolactate synthase I/III small subunit